MAPSPDPSGETATADEKAITLGHPSYVWRFGQDRRLDIVRARVPLEGASILDIGCGHGMYMRAFRRFSDDVHGVDIDPERVAKASAELPNASVAAAEQLPYPDERFDVVFLNEVIEHVDDDRRALAEAARVTRPGGHIVIYAPNRLYFFETHGAYFGKRYHFGNVPLVGWLPKPLRNRFAPHVRAYLKRDIERLLSGLPVEVSEHTWVYPGFDNITARHPRLGRVLRRILYAAERGPLRRFGLSHFVVVRKTYTSSNSGASANSSATGSPTTL